jgi:hypothetical protein
MADKRLRRIVIASPYSVRIYLAIMHPTCGMLRIVDPEFAMGMMAFGGEATLIGGFVAAQRYSQRRDPAEKRWLSGRVAWASGRPGSRVCV